MFYGRIYAILFVRPIIFTPYLTALSTVRNLAPGVYHVYRTLVPILFLNVTALTKFKLKQLMNRCNDTITPRWVFADCEGPSPDTVPARRQKVVSITTDVFYTFYP